MNPTGPNSRAARTAGRPATSSAPNATTGGIPVGDSHVKNGDRYRVLSPTTDGGLLVDDLGGRGRTLLPTAYVAEHVHYGWATTIDTAQGSTCDVAVLLVRPGLDREHLYVGLTRGRAENHAYIAATMTTNATSSTPIHNKPAGRILIEPSPAADDNTPHTPCSNTPKLRPPPAAATNPPPSPHRQRAAGARAAAHPQRARPEHNRTRQNALAGRTKSLRKRNHCR